MAEAARTLRGPDILLRTAPSLSAVTDGPLAALPVPPASASNDAADLDRGIAAEISPEEAAETDRARRPAAPKQAAPRTGPDDDLKEMEIDGRKVATPYYYQREMTQARNKYRTAEEKAQQAEAKLQEAEKSREATAAELAAMRARVEELQAKAEAIKPSDRPPANENAAPAEPRPARDAFDDPEAYDEALAAWGVREGERKAEQKAAAERAAAEAETKARTEAEAKAAQEAEIKRVNETWSSRKAAAAEKYEDFDAVTGSDDLKISPPMAHAIMLADNGPEIAYHLGKNPEESARIAAIQNPFLQAYELGRFATAIAQPAPRRAPRARPLEPIDSGSSAPADTSEREPSMDEWAARRSAHIASQRRPFFSSAPQPRH